MTTTPATEDAEWVFISLGKIVQFDGKQYGVCYVTYDSAFVDGRGEDNEQRVYKRGFTLPDLTLLRCNLFATVLAVEFAAEVVKRRRLGCKCVIGVKHRGAYDLATDPEAVSAASNALPGAGARGWPKRMARHATLLRRLVRSVRGCAGAIELAPVDPGRNVDGDLEFYANCDRDPLEHQDDERMPGGSEEFQELMRAAREHKRSANDLAEVGRVFPRTRMRKPTKKETAYVATSPAKSKPRPDAAAAAAAAATPSRGAEPRVGPADREKTKITSDAEFDALVKAFLGERAAPNDASSTQK